MPTPTPTPTGRPDGTGGETTGGGGRRYDDLFTGTVRAAGAAARFCPDCGTAGGGLDTCQGCGRSLLSAPRQAARLAEDVLVRAAARGGAAYRWARSPARTRTVRALAGASLLVAVAGGAFAAGHEVGGDGYRGMQAHSAVEGDHHGVHDDGRGDDD